MELKIKMDYYKNGFKKKKNTRTQWNYSQKLRERERERESEREAWSKLPKKTRRESERALNRPPLVRRERGGRKTTKETGN
jgi:hypothetical protein